MLGRRPRRPSPDPAVPGAAAPGTGRFADAAGRFTIAPPAGWRTDTGGALGAAVVFVTPTPTRTGAGSFSANINVRVVRSTADLRSTVVGARVKLRDLTAYTSTVDEPALIGGTQAHMLGGTFTDGRSGLELRNLQLFAVRGGATTVVTGTAAARGWDTYAPVFDEALRTLTIGG